MQLPETHCSSTSRCRGCRHERRARSVWGSGAGTLAATAGVDMKPVKTVIVSGSARRPSRTLLLAEQISRALAQHLDLDLHVVEIADVGSELGRALTRAELSAPAEQALRLVESAQILIAATPVYRGSYTGHFKHLFDLIEQEALLDVPVILAATGGGERHTLVIEHQLRPLFA